MPDGVCSLREASQNTTITVLDGLRRLVSVEARDYFEDWSPSTPEKEETGTDLGDELIIVADCEYEGTRNLVSCPPSCCSVCCHEDFGCEPQ